MVTDAQRILAPHIKLQTTLMIGFDERLHLVQRTLSLDKHGDEPAKPLLAGLYGMGGVGKTTLALSIHDTAAENFLGLRIYLSVGAQCKGERELRLQRCKLLQKLSGVNSQPSDSVPEERLKLRSALGGAGPLLLVLDDLWTLDQLHWLLACEDSGDTQAAVANLPAGSRVLLTSRNRRIVTVKGHEASIIFLAELDEQFSKQLLCQEAFPSSSPPSEFTEIQLMNQALQICGGLPLALQILGRQLRAQARSGWRVRSQPWPFELRIMRYMLS